MRSWRIVVGILLVAVFGGVVSLAMRHSEKPAVRDLPQPPISEIDEAVDREDSQPSGGTTALKIKVAMTLQFPKVVQWPEGTFASAEEPLVLGVLGGDGTARLFEEMVRGKDRLASRPLRVHYWKRASELGSCHLLFVSRAWRGDLAQLLAKRGPRLPLTLGDAAGFRQAGGMIELSNHDNRVRIDQNEDALKRAGIRISMKTYVEKREE